MLTVLSSNAVRGEGCHSISKPLTPKRKCHFDEIFVDAFIESCHLAASGQDNSGTFTENKRSSFWQLCPHWWHRKLPLRHPTVPPVTTKLSNWRFLIFSAIACLQGNQSLSPYSLCLALATKTDTLTIINTSYASKAVAWSTALFRWYSNDNKSYSLKKQYGNNFAILQCIIYPHTWLTLYQVMTLWM